MFALTNLLTTVTSTLSLLLVLLTTAPAVPAAPTTIVDRRATSANGTVAPPIILYVTSFRAYIPHDYTLPSEVHFHVSDKRPNAPLETECGLGGPAIHLDKGTFTDCAGGFYPNGASFWLSEGELVVRRAWVYDGDMIIRGEAPQGTYWAVGANKTIDDKGSTYSRPEEWQFAIKSAWA